MVGKCNKKGDHIKSLCMGREETFYGIKNKVGLENFHFNLTSDSSKVYVADIYEQKDLSAEQQGLYVTE